MPNRIIRESCRTSRTLAKASDFAERLFWRLTTCCDDHGRYHGSPSAVMTSAFAEGAPGLTIEKVISGLVELERLDLIRPYVVGDRHYLWMPTWKKHQRLRSGKSKFPEHPEQSEQQSQVVDSNDLPHSAANRRILPQMSPGTGTGTGTGTGEDPSPTDRAPRVLALRKILDKQLREDQEQFHLTPSGDLTRNGKGAAPNKKQKSLGSAVAERWKVPEELPWFCRFWEAHPYAQSGRNCEKIWRQRKLETIGESIVTALNDQLTWPQNSGERVQYFRRSPAWLNQSAWEDPRPKEPVLPEPKEQRFDAKGNLDPNGAYSIEGRVIV